MLSCINIIYNNIDCSLISTQPAQSRGTTYDGFSGHFYIYYFSLFVHIFDLVHAVDAILIPFKQLRASKIVCEI